MEDRKLNPLPDEALDAVTGGAGYPVQRGDRKIRCVHQERDEGRILRPEKGRPRRGP